MADNTNPTNPINPNNVRDAQDYLAELLSIRDISRDITSFTKELLKSTKLNVIEQSALLSAHKSVSKAINDQSDNILRVLNNEKSLKDIQKDIAKNKLLETRLTKELAGLTSQKLKLEVEYDEAIRNGNESAIENLIKQEKAIVNLEKALADQKGTIDEINQSNELAAKISGEANKKTKGFTFLSEFTKSVPGLKAISGPFEAAEKAARETALSGGKGIEILESGFEALGPAIAEALGPLVIFTTIVKVLKFFLDAMFEADKRVTNIAKSFSISKDNARATYQALIDSKSVLESELATTKNINEAFAELVSLSDFASQASFKQLDTQIKLTKEIGIQAEDATQLQQLFVLNNEESDKGLDIVYDQIAAFANQNKIVADGRKVISDINKLSSQTKLNFNGSTKELVGAVLNAKKLGLTLDQVSKIGSSLLDFESSISSQIEAELLTGRQINLEKARLFALNHDIAGLTEEINKQGITATKFTAMNVIQQEAIAKTLGMSASELGDSLYKQELINKVGGNNLKARREEIELLKSKGHLSEAQLKTAELAQLEQGLVTGKTLEQAQASLDAQTKFNTALDMAKEIFSDLVTGGSLDKLSDILIGVANTFSKHGLTVGMFSVGSEIKKATSERQLAKSQKQAKTNANLDEYNSPDNQPTSVPAQDFIIKTLPQDTIVAAGGTKLGNSDELLKAQQETNSYLKQLLAKDTNLYIDYNKFATAGSKQTYSMG